MFISLASRSSAGPGQQHAEMFHQDPRHPQTDPFKKSWGIPGRLTLLYSNDSSHLALRLTPTAKCLLQFMIALKQVELFADEVLILYEQTQHNLWLSFKRSWAPTASTSFLWSSKSSKAELACPQGLIFPQPQKHWKLKHKGYQKSVWKCTRLYSVH